MYGVVQTGIEDGEVTYILAVRSTEDGPVSEEFKSDAKVEEEPDDVDIVWDIGAIPTAGVSRGESVPVVEAYADPLTDRWWTEDNGEIDVDEII